MWGSFIRCQKDECDMTKIQDNACLCGTPTHIKFLFKTPDGPLRPTDALQHQSTWTSALYSQHIWWDLKTLHTWTRPTEHSEKPSDRSGLVETSSAAQFQLTLSNTMTVIAVCHLDYLNKSIPFFIRKETGLNEWERSARFSLGNCHQNTKTLDVIVETLA